MAGKALHVVGSDTWRAIESEISPDASFQQHRAAPAVSKGPLILLNYQHHHLLLTKYIDINTVQAKLISTQSQKD